MTIALDITEFALLIAWFVVFYLAYASKYIAKPSVTYKQIEGESMADSLTYEISAGPVVDADVVKRLLTLVVDGETLGTSELPASAADKLSVFSVNQGSTVVLTLVDVDDAGNESVPAVVEFVAADTLPPAQPHGLGVTLVGENLEHKVD